MTNNATPQAAARSAAPLALWLVLLAGASTFAMTMGTRQTMGLFLSALNTSTGLGIGSISLAFAFGQLWWGLTQPFAGAVADRIGAGHCERGQPPGTTAAAPGWRSCCARLNHRPSDAI